VAIVHRLEFNPPAIVEKKDLPVDLLIYRFSSPLAPGATGELAFDLEYTTRGFQNDQSPTGIVYNGSFMNSESLPQFGYQEGNELSEDAKRRKYHLPPKPRMRDLYDATARSNNYISNDADWVSFDATVSTSTDQIALAPGELVREWSENGRRYFHYQTRGPVLNFSSVLSARYRVMRDHWNDVALEIYYQPGHEYNLDQMMKGMKKSLEYCTANFSPYQNKTVRIIEFPRYASFAQSFPASIPFSESIGFIARVDPSNDEDVDYPFYVTAHEVAHQWWAHQVIGGNVQGATLMSESLAQYTAMMIMKHEYGPEHMQRFLKYAMDSYLSGRSSERKKELPLARVENQGYIHYDKAAVIFYALQDYAGEAVVNRALREYLQAVQYQQPPYTFSPELISRLRAVMPQPYLYVIGDMLESITLYENRALSATATKLPDGSYSVKLKVKARKIRAGELGEESDVPLNDWIDIGVLDGKGKPLYLERKKIDKAETEFDLNVKGVPATAGIDPWNKLVDRDPKDNTIKVDIKQATAGTGISTHRAWLLVAFPHQGRFGLANGEERLGHVIVPGEVLFVHQRPNQSDSAGTDAQPSAEIAQRPVGALRRKTVEVDQPELGAVLADRLPAADREYQTVESRNQQQCAAKDHLVEAVEMEVAAEMLDQRLEHSEENAAADEDHRGVENRGQRPVHGSSHLGVTVDSGFHGSLKSAGSLRGGLQRFKIEHSLAVVRAPSGLPPVRRLFADHRFRALESPRRRAGIQVLDKFELSRPVDSWALNRFKGDNFGRRFAND
ncbi:MAG TPA: M1 family aminopeptidase, partial [Bryobacteraceae bacterium]